MYLFFDLLIFIRKFYLAITFPQIKQKQTLSLICIVNTADISKQLTACLPEYPPVLVNIITSGLLFIYLFYFFIPQIGG